MSDLSIAAVDRLVRKAGAERVSESAAKALRDVLEDMALEIAAKSVQLAKHAGRTTVNEEDIKVATH